MKLQNELSLIVRSLAHEIRRWSEGERDQVSLEDLALGLESIQEQLDRINHKLFNSLEEK
jgi:hypothetical protein